MSIISFDPKNNIIPIGLYIDEVNYRCKLLYPTCNNNNQWVFPDTYLSLKYSKTYYVISPSILPLPPFVKIYYTIISSEAPYNIVAIKELTDPYDFNGILNINKSDYRYTLDIVLRKFGAIRYHVTLVRISSLTSTLNTDMANHLNTALCSMKFWAKK